MFQTLQMEADVRGLGFRRHWWLRLLGNALRLLTFLLCFFFFICLSILTHPPFYSGCSLHPPIHHKTIKVLGCAWEENAAFPVEGGRDHTGPVSHPGAGLRRSKPLPAGREYPFRNRWMWEGGVCVQNTGHLLFIMICTDGRFHTS